MSNVHTSAEALSSETISKISEWLARNVIEYMRSDIKTMFVPARMPGERSGYKPFGTVVELTDIEEHVANRRPIGLYMMDPKHDGEVRCAVIDIDDKSKKLSWEELCCEARAIKEELESRLLLTWSCRSGSGHGIHLWLFWTTHQPARIVRQVINQCLEKAKPRVHVDVFPAQDTLFGGVGNLVAVPLSRKSRPLNLDDDTCVENLALWDARSPAMSAPVIRPTVLAGAAPTGPMEIGNAPSWMNVDTLAADAGKGLGDDGYGPPDPNLLAEALAHVPADDYGIWLRVGLALKCAVADLRLLDDVAKELWDKWAERCSEKFNSRTQDYTWNRFRPRPGGVSLGTIWWIAKEYGWKPSKDDLAPPKKPVTFADPVPPIMDDSDETMIEKSPPSPRIDTSRDNDQASGMAGRMGPSSPDPLQEDETLKHELLWKSGGGEDEVKMMNTRHFCALDSGKFAVFREEWDDVLGRHHLERITPTDFKGYYQNRQILIGMTRQGKPQYRPMGEYWLESPYRRQYRKMVMRPEGAAAWCYNLWRGWTVQPSEEGDWSLLRQHIYDNLCSQSDEAFDYVINWWARTVQKPELPIGTALVLRGAKGTGKSSFARAFGELFGQHFLHVTNSKAVTGNFNSHLRDCVVLFADEAVWAGNRSEEGALKGMITEPTIVIEGKGRDMVTCRNMIHLVVAANADWAVPAGMDERRFCVLEVSDAKKQDSDYFRAIQKQLQNGGQARLLHDLLARDVRKFDPAKVPQTEGLLNQKIQSLEPFALWWYQCLNEGRLYQEQGEFWEEARADLAYKSYTTFCREGGYRYAGSLELLRRAIQSKLLSKLHAIVSFRKTVLVDEKVGEMGNVRQVPRKVTYWRVPTLRACRMSFEKALNGSKIGWAFDLDKSGCDIRREAIEQEIVESMMTKNEIEEGDDVDF